MADTALQERLRESSDAFSSLLSIIPSKMYYGEEPSGDQWMKKKQTKEQAKAARRGRLDPDSELNRNAKEVMEQRARNKRKLRDMLEHETPKQDEIDDDEGGDEDGDDDVDDSYGDIEREKPGEGLKKRKAKAEANKKQKILDTPTLADGDEERTQQGPGEDEPVERAEKLSARQEKKLLKQQKKHEKRAGKKAEKNSTKVENKEPEANDPSATDASLMSNPRMQQTQSKAIPQSTQKAEEVDESEDRPPMKADSNNDEAGQRDSPELVEQKGEIDAGAEELQASSTSDSAPQSPTFDFDSQNHEKQNSAEPTSTTTSISSTVAASEKPKQIKVPADTTALRARLALRIEELRAARKADGTNGRPIRTRQELIESRREKQAQRKAHKKELRKQAKLEEERKREEAIASARTSPGSIMSPMLGLKSDAEEKASNHFTFGRIAFTDGTQMSHDLSYVKEADKTKKGPSDPKTALLKVQAEKKRVAGLDDDKRKEVLSKEMWLAARRRAEGDKVREDEAILKKAVKRKDKAKRKSEKEWSDRTKGVETAIRERQRRREDNLRARRDDKTLRKMGHKKKKPPGLSKGKKKARPGFEGSLVR